MMKYSTKRRGEVIEVKKELEEGDREKGVKKRKRERRKRLVKKRRERKRKNNDPAQ